MESLRRQFEDMVLVIIDEMSLVGADFLYNVHKRLAEIMRNDEMFANRALLLVGDLLQIPPTKQRPIYDEPTSMQNQALYTSDGNLWKSCETVHLIANKRQGAGKWKDALDRMRVGGMNSDDAKLLETRRVTNEEHRNKDYVDALHLFFSNEEVCNHNKTMINNLEEVSKCVQADIRGFPKGFYPEIKYGTFVEDTRMQKYLTLKKGARVILNFNVDISDSLVNGITGNVIGYVYRQSKSKENLLVGSNIKAVIIKSDDPSVGEDCKKINKDLDKLITVENGIPIFRKTMRIRPHRLPNSAEVTVEQFPLNLFYASTSHKIQGKTLKNQDVVCYTHPKIKNGCAYVMLSRCTSIDNVYISKDFDIKKIRPHLLSLKETNKLIKKCFAANLKQDTFDIFYLNMHGKSHFIDVKHDPYALQSNLVCLVETNLDATSTFHWPERKNLSHASAGLGSGVCGFVKETPENSYHFIASKIGNRFQILQLIKEDTFQIFILYVSQDANLSNVVSALQDMILDDLKPIMFGDFNFHSDSETPNDLSSYLTKVLRLQQLVTGPTYLFGPNTIDHIYVPSELSKRIHVTSRFNYYSDHMSFNISFK